LNEQILWHKEVLLAKVIDFAGNGSPGTVKQRIWIFLVYLALVMYISMTLLPLLSSGYYSDDLVFSSIKGQIKLNNSSLFNYIYNYIVSWMNNGRFVPMAFISTLPIIYFPDDYRLYKAVILLIVILNALSFSFLIKGLTKDRYLSLYSLLLLPIFFQFRLYHDPILSFSGLLPLFMLIMVCAMLYFAKYLENDKPIHLIISLILYNICLYFTESSVPLIVLFWLMVMYKSPHSDMKLKIYKVMPHLLFMLLAVAVAIIVRMTKNTPSAAYEGTAINLHLVPFAKTLLLQLYSTLPMSYFISNPSQIDNHNLRGILSGIDVTDYLAIFIFVMLSYYLLNRINDTRKSSLLIWLGMPFVLIPAALISLTVKYQRELQQAGPGMGYIHVYSQYFGGLLIALGILLYLVRKTAVGKQRVALYSVIIILTSMMMLLNKQSNRAVVDISNIDLHFRREALALALKDDILQSVPENSRLLILDEYAYNPYPPTKSHLKGWAAGGYPWKNQALVYQYSGKRMKVYSDLDKLREADKSVKERKEGVMETYALTIKSFPATEGVKDGYVELSRLTDTSWGGGQVHYDSAVMKTYLPQKNF